jgi:hypothetical protein
MVTAETNPAVDQSAYQFTGEYRPLEKKLTILTNTGIKTLSKAHENKVVDLLWEGDYEKEQYWSRKRFWLTECTEYKIDSLCMKVSV